MFHTTATGAIVPCEFNADACLKADHFDTITAARRELRLEELERSCDGPVERLPEQWGRLYFHEEPVRAQLLSAAR